MFRVNSEDTRTTLFWCFWWTFPTNFLLVDLLLTHFRVPFPFHFENNRIFDPYLLTCLPKELNIAPVKTFLTLYYNQSERESTTWRSCFKWNRSSCVWWASYGRTMFNAYESCAGKILFTLKVIFMEVSNWKLYLFLYALCSHTVMNERQ